jgi:tetratricopeptide (TPR) repeat protein
MVIGSLSRFRRFGSIGLLLLAFGVLSLRATADQIKLTSGSTLEGEITGVSNGSVSVTSHTSNGGMAKQSFPLDSIQSVTMQPPAALAALKGATPAAVVAGLEPVVKEYAGLPTDWIIGAMGQLADAYDTLGQADRASAIYTQIGQLYPNSPAATAGTAKLDLKAGKIDQALALVQPLVDKANQDLAPSKEDGFVYAGAFLVYGQAMQAKKQDAKALEAYLTVKTMFYQNPALVEQADQLAQALRQQDPSVSVE